MVMQETSDDNHHQRPLSILVLGSGALQIGQAGEFDYSGAQALKAFREAGIKTVLINPNIATIQTSNEFADKVYLLPVTPHFVEEVIVKEEIDSITLSFGGQTALNCGLEMETSGAIERLGVRVLGTPLQAVRDTEDRQLFIEKLDEIDVKTARSKAATSVEGVMAAAEEIGLPVILRGAFALGGAGSAIVHDTASCLEAAHQAIANVDQVLVEECLFGWKEIEYEIVRDARNNCIAVCNMENVDPMGIHTGESIVVAPSQTLNDHEYQLLRDVALKTIRHLGIVGECNIQYALDPVSSDYRVIEVNARLSRSSALASKATGYPLAYVAARIALGDSLPEIPNAITRTTTAFFEPAMDYIVCKMPRWDLDKFEGVNQRIGTEMKSVGEVMSIGRTFPEALQKALRMLEIGVDGLDPLQYADADIEKSLSEPSPMRIFAVAAALDRGMSVEEVSRLTAIDAFFLHEIAHIVHTHQSLRGVGRLDGLDRETLSQAKQSGFSDRTIAECTASKESEVRARRHSFDIRPHLAQIDTLAGEYPTETNYLYMSYRAQSHDVQPTHKEKVLVLGSGVYRIGSSVEFDWCAVNAVTAARRLGYEAILLNCNPETVSTDYDVCDRLVFDEITLEVVLEVIDAEKPIGVLVSMGGQVANNLALKLHQAGVRILGTSPESIDRAEDRKKFSGLLDEIGVGQPKWAEATDADDLEVLVEGLGGFPVLVRPSYVLSGAAMRVCYDRTQLHEVLGRAADVSPEHPVIATKFERYSREIEYDAVACEGEIVFWAISEHIEDAGVHSGDATLVLPPHRLYLGTVQQVRLIAERLAQALKVTGPFNIQFLARHNQVKVIECNLRASRSFPFVSKVLGINFIHEATRVALGEPKSWMRGPHPLDLPYSAVKSPQFSFRRLKGADPRLGVEMASTGEVACFGRDMNEALLKAMLATGFKYPEKDILIAIGPEREQYRFAESAKALHYLGHTIIATPDTAAVFHDEGCPCEVVTMAEVADLLQTDSIDLVINVPDLRPDRDQEGFLIRRTTIDQGIPIITEPWLARRVVEALGCYRLEDLQIEPLSFYRKNHEEIR